MTDAEPDAEIRKAGEWADYERIYAADRLIARHFYRLAAERCATMCAVVGDRQNSGTAIRASVECAAACCAIGEDV